MRVFVLSKNGNPLTPTTPCRARKLLKAGVAKKVWSKFNTFGIQMLVEVGDKVPEGFLGCDFGTKFEGYSAVVGNKNILNVKLDLPSKTTISNKIIERKNARRSRRYRLRRRPARFNNCSRKGYITPSQLIIVLKRIYMIKNICKIYPIKHIGIEDVCFNHRDKRWGSNFSTIEVGKNKIREFVKSIAELFEYKGWETKEARESFGYKKISSKSKNCFESHCCDSLTICCKMIGERIEPNKKIITVDETYLPVRRKIHDTNYSRGGIKKNYSRGNVKGFQKGKLIGYKGKEYILTGITKNKYRLSNINTKKSCNEVNKVDYISTQYITI